MSDRDELIKVIHDVHHGDCTNPDECIDGIFTDEETAMAILARWRLVPVVPSWEDAPPNGYTRGGLKLPLVPCDTCTAECTCPEQHRAASELTRQDMDEGIYEIELARCSCGKQAIRCAEPKTRRTDNHGPHED